MRMILLASLVPLMAACARDPAEAVCPDVQVGDLVITEVAGTQTGMDGLVPWIEVYNASGGSLELRGMKIRFRKLTGDEIGSFSIRRDLTLSDGEYATFGLTLDNDAVSYVDYGIAADFHASWPSTAAVDIQACNVQIDRAQYENLPKTGTYSLGAAPTADANDLPANWCTDATPNVGSFPGSPQRMNKACP